MFKDARRSAAALAVVVAALVPAPALADQAVNPFSGQWLTNASGLTGGVNFSVVDPVQGAQELAGLGGTACAAPTTYYHGDYHDSYFPEGVVAGCTTAAGHLVARFQVSVGPGSLDLTLSPDGADFSGPFAFDGGFGGTFLGHFAAHFPGDGCCSAAPSAGAPAGGTPAAGGAAAGAGAPGGSIATTQSATSSGTGLTTTSPSLAGVVFCAQRSAPPCAPGQIVSAGEKASLRVTLRRQRSLAAALCGLESAPGLGATALRLACASQVGFMADALEQIDDPADPAFRRVALVRRARATSQGAGGLAATARAWAAALGRTAALSRAAAKTVDRFAGATAKRDAAAAFLQAALGKVIAGQLATALKAQAAAGKAYALALRHARLDPRVAADAAALPAGALDAIVADGLAASRGAARREIAAQLALARGPLRLRSVAATVLPTAALVAEARTITSADLAAIVEQLRSQNSISAATRQTLLADLAAGSACRFAAHAKALPAATYGPVLASAAAPLAGSCRS